MRRPLALGSLLVAQLSFAAVTYSQTSPAGLQVSPTSIDFGTNSVNSESPAQTVTVSNPTNAPVTLEQIIASGIDFSEKHDCGQTLAPGAQCTVQVFFSPAIPGVRTGNLAVMESNGNAHIVPLNGTGK